MKFPFIPPSLGTFDYAVPRELERIRQKMYWDCELPIPLFGRYKKPEPSGVYIWHENHHGINEVLYIGASEQLWTRCYQHRCWTGSSVYEWRLNHLQQKFEPCSRWPNECDCLPRYNVRIFFGVLYGVEAQLIALLNPPLNRVVYKDETIERRLNGDLWPA